MTTKALLDAACVIERRIYLLFPADLRLTLYSQQVRALTLVEALREQDWMATISSIAIVGGGASGMAAAAALKVAGLREDLNVTLFETLQTLVPLQTGCHDKLLAPYLIDWPRPGSDAEDADLPILTWSKADAATVAQDLTRQFDRFGVDVRRGSKIVAIRDAGNAVEIDVERAAGAARFDLVVVAAGFGLEDHPAGVKKPTNSYWRVNPRQQPALAPASRRRILISGLGDGALIDFVLFACSGLSHQELCSALCESPDAQGLFGDIEALEERIWADPSDVADIAKAYQALNIDKLARSLVLPWLVHDCDFTLITRGDQLFQKGTAPINRLAAALVIRAIEIEPRGNSVRTLVQASLGDDAGGLTTFSHIGRVHQEAFDEVVIRHGDTSASAWSFANAAITAKVAELREQRRTIAIRPLTPRLPSIVSEAIEARMFETIPTRVRLNSIGNGNIRWNGDLAPDSIGRLWRVASAKLQIDIGFPPKQPASKLDLALCRLFAHAEPQAQLTGPHRQTWIDLMAEVPRRAGDQTRPPVAHVGINLASRIDITMEEDHLASRIEASLDNGLLRLLAAKVRVIDAGTAHCPVDFHPDIKAGAIRLWTDWLAAVGQLSSDHRSWVMRLFGGLLNEFGEPDSWSGVRVGPKCVDGELLPAILFHLAMQHLLGFGHAEKSRKGNVARLDAAGKAMDAAHFCGTRWAVELAGPRTIADWEPKWAGAQWQPSCLVLPTRLNGFLPRRGMLKPGEDAGMLTPDWTLPSIIYSSPELRGALRAGPLEATAAIERLLHRRLPEI